MTHLYYNRDNFPRLVWARKESNWHIYANEKGHCAAIPVVHGALASDFGDLAHVAKVKRFPYRDDYYFNRTAKWKG